MLQGDCLMQLNLSTAQIIGIAVIVIALLLPRNNTPVPTPVPTPIPVTPDLQAAVASIQTLAKQSPSAAKQVGFLYRDIANVLLRDSGNSNTIVIKTTGQLREGIRISEQLFAQKTNLPSQLPELSPMINQVFDNQLTLKDQALTSDLRQKAVNTANAIAWALGS